MKLKPVIAAMPIIFTMLTGCTSDPQHAVSVYWPFKPSAVQQAKTNGEIIEDAITLNHAEIKASRYAQHNAHFRKIKQFAAKLHHEHLKDLHHIKAISHKTGIAPVQNADANHIKHESQEKLTELKTLSKSDFDKVFIKDLIHCHEYALNWIDVAILQSSNAELTAYLKDNRHHVSEHLHQAKALQKELHLN